MRVAPDPGVGRLKRRPDFLAVAEGGRRFHTGRMSVQGRRRDADLSGLRVGITVTKRVGHATERNRIRRRFRAAAAEAMSGRDAEPMDLVLVGRRDALSAGFDLLVADLRQALGTLTKPNPGRRAPGEPGDDAARRHPS